MSCTFSRDTLALYAEGDLATEQADITSHHFDGCEECQSFLEQLRRSQTLLKSLRREVVRPSECARMRGAVMSIINDRPDVLGWRLRIERAIAGAFRQPSHALAACALVGVLSLGVLSQARHATVDMRQGVAVLDGTTLVLPEDYRDWVLVSRSANQHTLTPKVYINPFGYRAYESTGTFPEGTVMIWESDDREPGTADRPHRDAPVLLASIKDGRFEDGWGYFDFTGRGGTATTKARALPGSSGCRTCHRKDAETDHVLTQFSPTLHTAHRGAHPLPVPSASSRFTQPQRAART